ncbi:hypothetical protein [Pleomorphomonas carboxyditropha]|uniref:Cap15 family cyclic dinucleotide receptor domain-containing protein n=1 Tax=Pleomorphomonas carboxyditropha TaxID=2023338 RepID=UPI001054FC15|nr:hypothetical protein [Pleomorphomonas carboxyditropha]
MYQILGIRRSLSLFGLLCALVFTAWAILAPPTDQSSFVGWWQIASEAVFACGTAVTLVGQSPFFALLCRLPLVRNWFPPIDGEWKAILESNWPAIQQRACPGAASVPLVAVPATVTIIARLFYIRMNLISDSRYSTSKTIFVRATRDPEDGSVTLHCHYENTTKVPETTDSSSHYGAANLCVERQGDNIWLEGVYWTNRNWHLGLNTAGKMTLRRA